VFSIITLFITNEEQKLTLSYAEIEAQTWAALSSTHFKLMNKFFLIYELIDKILEISNFDLTN
jgi:hypothetical protein